MLHNILQRDKSDLIVKIYQAQLLKPARHDWAQIVQMDKSKYDISLTDLDISKMSKGSYQKLIESKVNQKSFLELNQSNKSKIQNILQNLRPGENWKLPLKEYLKTNLLTTEEKQVLFSLRCREYDVKTNYKNKYEEDMTCRICREEKSEEDELHTFFKCKILTHDIKIDPKSKFDHIFGSHK